VSDHAVLAALARALTDLVAPLSGVTRDEASFRRFLLDMGWTFNAETDLAPLRTAADDAVTAVSDLVDAVQTADLEALSRSLGSLQRATGSLTAFGTAVKGLVDAGADANVARELANDVLAQLTIVWVKRSSLGAFNLLWLLGLLDFRTPPEIPAAGTAGLLRRHPIPRVEIIPEAIGGLLTDPISHLRARLEVQAPADDAEANRLLQTLLEPLFDLASGIGGLPVPAADRDFPVTVSDRTAVLVLPIPPGGAPRAEPEEVLVVAIEAVPTGKKSTDGDDGPGIRIRLDGHLRFNEPLSRTPQLTAALTAGSSFFLPLDDRAPTVHDSAAGGALEITLSSGTRPANGDQTGPLAGADTIGLRVGGCTAKFAARFGRPAGANPVGVENRVDVDVSVAANRAAFVLRPAAGDGFLRAVLPAEGVRFDFDLGLGWSNQRGVYVLGGGALHADLPVHLQLFGVVSIDAVHLDLTVGQDAGVDVSTSVRVNLGVLQATIERVGMSTKTSMPRQGGNTGPLQLDPAFKPPDGVGLLLNAVVMSGGGYVSNDKKGTYTGALQLRAFDVLDVTAVGLLATNLPGGGYSLLAVLNAQFPQIPIGFGFFLSGLGGLLGLNRTMDPNALGESAHNGSLESLLFPVDPVPRARKVISDLAAVFPEQQGRTVIGLMARIGWGSPRLVTIDLGLIVAIPSPLIIALLGRMSAHLPSEKLDIVELHLDIAGSIDFGRHALRIDADLYRSRIAFLEVSGSLVLRLSWDANPYFAIAIGGFHHGYRVEPSLSGVLQPANYRRMCVSVGNDNAYIRLTAFLAITSNTVQFGAELSAHAHIYFLGKWSADAWVEFAALFYLSPFSFVINLSLGIAIKYNDSPLLGADVDVTVSGPQPMRAVGRANVHLLFFTISIPFEVTEGSGENEQAIADVDPFPLLVKAVEDKESWSAQPPATSGVGVRSTEGELLAHPLGSLTVHQRVIPLDLQVQRYAGAPLPGGGPGTYTLTYAVSGKAVTGTARRDAWAPGDLFELSNDEKLAAPSFQQLVSGHERIAAAQVAWGTPVEAPTGGYETRVIDMADPAPLPPPTAPRMGPHPAQVAALLTAQVVASSGNGSPGGLFGPALGVRVAESTYRLASVTDMSHDGTEYLSWAEAAEAAKGRTGVQIVEAHEVDA
jgi:hypothetical protein